MKNKNKILKNNSLKIINRNLRLKLKKKNQQLKKLNICLTLTKLNKQKQKHNYNLILLNIFLILIILLFIYLKFYRIAFVVFGYLIIKNNSSVKEIFNDYLIQQGRFNKYYKKNFPGFFYGLPIIGIGSFIGLIHTLSIIGMTFEDLILKTNAPWYVEYQMEQFEIQLYFFLTLYLCCIIIHLGISLYVIRYANSPINKYWKPIMSAVKITGAVGAATVGVTIAAEAPVAPNKFSQYVHTKTYLGRGWDAELGDFHGKVAATKLQNLVGQDKFSELVGKFSKDGIVSRETIETMLNDAETKKTVNEKATFLERQMLGLPILNIQPLNGEVNVNPNEPNADVPTDTEKSKTEKNKPLKKTVRFDEDETIIETESSETKSPDNNWPYNETSEEDYEEKVSKVPENSPGKKAVRDQDLEETKKRLKKKK